VGAVKTAGTTDEGVLRAAQCVADMLNKNAMSPLKLSHVVSATAQVVSGMRYTMVAEFTKTGCAFGTCTPLQYRAEVWLRPWLADSCIVESTNLVFAWGCVVVFFLEPWFESFLFSMNKIIQKINQKIW
jgi:hypothetical protein